MEFKFKGILGSRARNRSGWNSKQLTPWPTPHSYSVYPLPSYVVAAECKNQTKKKHGREHSASYVAQEPDFFHAASQRFKDGFLFSFFFLFFAFFQNKTSFYDVLLLTTYALPCNCFPCIGGCLMPSETYPFGCQMLLRINSPNNVKGYDMLD